MSDLISDRLARRVVLLLLIVKVIITAFDLTQQGAGGTYDYRHHAWRARSAGLEMGKMAYNPPLYYLPTLPYVQVSKYYEHGKAIIDPDINPGDASDHGIALLERVRAFNVLYLLVFYVSWIYFLFPRLFESRRAWFLASLLMLSLPGYQKAAVMAHPDNLLMALSATGTAAWVFVWQTQRTRFRHGLGLAFSVGLVGLTRPFAIVPVFFLSLANGWMQVKDAVFDASRAARPLYLRSVNAALRVAAIAAVTASLAGSWWVFRYVETGEILDAYAEPYIEHFEPFRKNFDYRHYYTSFYFPKLIEKPNREMSGSNEPSDNIYGNTFPTIVYSEIWGDHWLYFSQDASQTDQKAWEKRVVFVLALPLSIAVIVLLFAGIGRAAVRAVRTRDLSPHVVLPAIACVGWALFVYWQGHSGLLPGKNSTIKFLYFAYVTPYAIFTAFDFRPRERLFHWMVAGTLIVFAATLPIALVDARYLFPSP